MPPTIKQNPRFSQKEIIAKISEHYLGSHDFNGYPIRQMPADFGIPSHQALPLIRSLVQQGRLSVITPHDENPHIKRFQELPKAKQLELLKSADPIHTCVYPSRSYLRSVVNQTKHRKRPFTLELMFGEAQLAYRVFDLSVLEFYRNDPRYYYYCDDIAGSIHVGKHGKRMRQADRVFLTRFGFAYNAKHHRAVAAYLRDLTRLSPQHQQMWRAKQLRGGWKLHPDYYRSSILGDWPQGISIFAVTLEEMKCVNDMCTLIGRPALFKDHFQHGRRPTGSAFLIRPTLQDINDSLQLIVNALPENSTLLYG
jgi:hypothetical protein